MQDQRSEQAEAVVSSRPVQEKSAVAARQGVISGRVITVLVVSLLLAVGAMAIGYWAVR